MPYINKDLREKLTLVANAESPGELNYIFTTLLLDYVHRHGTSYQIINDVIGALEGAKLEFYRRFASEYEDKKKSENGDVY